VLEDVLLARPAVSQDAIQLRGVEVRDREQVDLASVRDTQCDPAHAAPPPTEIDA